MRSEKEIHRQVESLVNHHFEDQVQEKTRRLPNNCVHHLNHNIDVRERVNGERNPAYNRLDGKIGLEVVGLCMYGSEDKESWPGNICEDELDAIRCPLFTPLQSVGEIKEEFENQLKDPHWVKEKLPEVAALLWVTAGTRIMKPSLGSRILARILLIRNWLLKLVLPK